MTKWEYLVVGGTVQGRLKGSQSDWNDPLGFYMNDKEVLFETVTREGRESLDTKGEIYKKWNTDNHHQILNELGAEGWELIKIRQNQNQKRPRFYFKRPVLSHGSY